MIGPETILLFLVLQLALYGVPLWLLVRAVRTRKRDPGTSYLLMALAAVPFAYYAYCLVTEKFMAPAARDLQVASWPRKPVTPDTMPKVLVTTAGWSVAKTLVGAGPFEKAYGRGTDGWYVYERSGQPGCPSTGEWPRYSYDADRLKPTHCVTAAKAEPPRPQEPHLRLLTDEHAPSRHRPKEGVVSSSTLELRWSENAGGELIAFWEIPYFNVVSFPPIWMGFKGWARDALYAPRREQRPDPRTFLVEAIAPAR